MEKRHGRQSRTSAGWLAIALTATSPATAFAGGKAPTTSAGLPPPPASGRVSDQDCSAARASRPSGESTTLAMLGDAIASSTRATCAMQSVFDNARKALREKPAALALLDQAQQAWFGYVDALETELFPDQADPHAAYGSIYPVCYQLVQETFTKLRTKALATSTGCKDQAKAAPKTRAALAQAEEKERALLARIKQLYSKQRAFIAALDEAQRASEQLASVQVALAAQLAGGPAGECAARQQRELAEARTAQLQGWLSIGSDSDNCGGSQGSGLSFSPDEQQHIVKDSTKRTLAARDAVKKLRPEAERLTRALAAARTKLESLGKEKNSRNDAAAASYLAYKTARRQPPPNAFPKQQLQASVAAYRAARDQDLAYSKQLYLVRKLQTDLGKAVTALETAAADAEKAGAAARAAETLLQAWQGAPSADAATKAMAAVEQEAGKAHAAGVPGSSAELAKASQADEVRWSKEFPSRDDEASDGFARRSYELKLSADPKLQKQCDLKALDWKNFTFPPNSLVSDPFKLKAGSAEDISTDVEGNQHGQMMSLQQVEYADLDRDGRPEAYAVVIVGGVGLATLSTTAAYVFDTDASCSLRYVTQLESCANDLKLVGPALQAENCETSTRDDYTLADGELHKVRSKKIKY